MSAQPRPTPAQATQGTTPENQRNADTQYYREALHQLIDMGMAIARTVTTEIQANAAAKPVTPEDHAPAPNGANPDLTTRFDRIARCVRRTIRLAQHIAEPSRPATTPDHAQARAIILRGCENNIVRAAFYNRTQVDSPARHMELLERLDSLDLDRDIDTRPLPDIIKEICKDLGLGLEDLPGNCPAPRRTPHDVALLHARAATPPGTMSRTTSRNLDRPPVHDG